MLRNIRVAPPRAATAFRRRPLEMLQRPNHGLALNELFEEAISNVDVTYPKSFLSALAHEALGNAAQARKEYEAALPRLEAEVEKAPARARQHSFLGRVYAAD